MVELLDPTCTFPAFHEPGVSDEAAEATVGARSSANKAAAHRNAPTRPWGHTLRLRTVVIELTPRSYVAGSSLAIP